MRNPLAPIPSPVAGPVSERFWRRPAPPPPLRAKDVTAPQWDPTRLLTGGHSDTHGIDRRAQARGTRLDGPPTGMQVIAGSHRPIDAIVGLAVHRGWVLVRTLTLAPTGVLVTVVDLMDPRLRDTVRLKAADALSRIGRALTRDARSGSPLATVGGCLLGPRVVADLARLTEDARPRRTSIAGSTLAVDLLIPRLDPSGAIARISGTLVPLTDPSPVTLAIQLSPSAAELLACSAGPRR